MGYTLFPGSYGPEERMAAKQNTKKVQQTLKCPAGSVTYCISYTCNTKGKNIAWTIFLFWISLSDPSYLKSTNTNIHLLPSTIVM